MTRVDSPVPLMHHDPDRSWITDPDPDHSKGTQPKIASHPKRPLRVRTVLWLPGGVLPYMGYIGMCGPKGYGFSAVLVINKVSNLADTGHK